MKKLLFLLALPFIFAACGDDDEELELQKLEAAYIEVQENIVGSWVMDAYYNQSTSDPYIKLGWNSPWPYEGLEQYRYTFYSNGTVIDGSGKTYNFSLEIDKNKEVVLSGENGYWPFRKGAITLKFNNYSGLFSSSHYVIIKDDGLMYFYQTSSANGLAQYRYMKQ